MHYHDSHTRFTPEASGPLFHAAAKAADALRDVADAVGQTTIAALLPVMRDTVGGEELQTVDARKLHEFLGVEARFADWFARRIAEYALVEGVDFFSNLRKSSGGRRAKEYTLTISAAKELCMIEKTERGKEARLYFIEMERRAKAAAAAPAQPKPGSIILDFGDLRSVRQSFAALLDHSLELENQRDEYMHKFEAAIPAVAFCRNVLRSNAEMLISDFGRILKPRYPELGPNKIFERLGAEGYLFKRGKKWRPQIQYVESGLFHVRYGAEYTNAKTGATERDIQAFITEKGRQHFVRKWGIRDYEELIAADQAARGAQ